MVSLIAYNSLRFKLIPLLDDITRSLLTRRTGMPSISSYTDFFNSRLFPISKSQELEKTSIQLSLTKKLFRFSNGR